MLLSNVVGNGQPGETPGNLLGQQTMGKNQSDQSKSIAKEADTQNRSLVAS